MSPPMQRTAGTAACCLWQVPANADIGQVSVSEIESFQADHCRTTRIAIHRLELSALVALDKVGKVRLPYVLHMRPLEER